MARDKANDIVVLDRSVLVSCTYLDGFSYAAASIEKCSACDNFLEDAAPGYWPHKLDSASWTR
jgi:hypothetical protein